MDLREDSPQTALWDWATSAGLWSREWTEIFASLFAPDQAVICGADITFAIGNISLDKGRTSKIGFEDHLINQD